ncbi:MAG: pyruvate kinase [Saprospiraceae bacterium]|jgi:pyruvate kinase
MTDERQKTKIVATIGPVSSSKERLRELIKAGVNIFRLNFSHGAHKDHKEVLDRILELNKEHGTHVGILADLQGPKLRVGKVQEGGIPLEQGQIITFTNEECIGTAEKVYMSYPQFAQDVNVGERVLCDDGKILFDVVETDKKGIVKLKALYKGLLQSNKGVNLPDTNVSQPCLTKKDLIDLDFVLTLPVNWIALSFVRTAADVKELKRIIEAKGHSAKVIAKIEKPQAVKNIKSIIKASNGIMIARGDLGVEVPIEKVPTIQKDIIRRCIQWARPVIVATQMMESMMENPSPSRAEVTDVANAVLDGTDAVMLSGETSVGKHPVETVQAMNNIIYEAEQHYEFKDKRPKLDRKSNTYLSDVACITAAETAERVRSKAICGLTVSGYTAFKVSSYRPNTQICIFSSSDEMLKTLNLVWGVKCFVYDKFTTTDGTIEDTINILKQKGVVKVGETVINTGSMPIEKRFRTNMLKITVVE